MFGVSKILARQILPRKSKMVRLVRAAYQTFTGNEKALRHVRADLFILFRLVKSWNAGDYRRIPWKSMVWITAALIYFVNPIDVIPDALAVIGFVDDIAVLTAVLKAVRDDLSRYSEWEQANTPRKRIEKSNADFSHSLNSHVYTS